MSNSFRITYPSGKREEVQMELDTVEAVINQMSGLTLEQAEEHGLVVELLGPYVAPEEEDGEYAEPQAELNLEPTVVVPPDVPVPPPTAAEVAKPWETKPPADKEEAELQDMVKDALGK